MQPDNLWAPWRMAYIGQLEAQEKQGAAQPCFLCESAKADAGTDDAAARLVLLNDRRGQIVLNRYPYTNGHLLVAPQQHLADLTDMTPPARADLMELTHLAERLLRTAMHPQGINIGINLGRCAGAGLPGHLHVHVLPRWSGDTNFITTIGHVRVIPQAVEQTYEFLYETLGRIDPDGLDT